MIFSALGTIGGLFGLNPLGKAAKALGGVLALVALVGLLWGAKAAYDSRVVENANNRAQAQAAKADRKADAKAAEERRTDDTRLATEAAELRKASENADNPTARRVARQRCIRLQQAARAAGSEPPACP